MNRQEHWNRVYQTESTQDVSWYERRPDLLEMIAASGVGKDAGIIDVGGSTSTLVDCLLDDGFTRFAVSRFKWSEEWPSLELAARI
jgi:hypothetical protein